MFWLTIITIFASLLLGLLLRKRLPGRSTLLLAIVLGLTGATLLWFYLPELNESIERLHWPSVTGAVDSSYIGGKRAFHPEIRYRYDLDSRTFHGVSDLGTPGFGGRKSRQQTSRHIISAYPPGKQIQVYYNPSNPAESRLVRRLPWNLLMKLGLGYLLVTASLILLTAVSFSPGSKP